MQQVTSCGAIIFRPQDIEIEYLLIRQTQNQAWAFPKGHMESGENYLQTAIREVKEETNLDIAIVDGFQEQISYSHEPNIQKTVIFFLAQVISFEVQGQKEEVDDLAWLKYSEAFQKLTYPDFKRLLVSAHQFLTK